MIEYKEWLEARVAYLHREVKGAFPATGKHQILCEELDDARAALRLTRKYEGLIRLEKLSGIGVSPSRLDGSNTD